MPRGFTASVSSLSMGNAETVAMMGEAAMALASNPSDISDEEAREAEEVRLDGSLLLLLTRCQFRP